MAVAFDNTKYDVQLNDVPYRVRGYQRTELSTFIPRLGVGEQKESEFDLLRSKTLSLDGGSLQRVHVDDSMVYGLEGAFTKYQDGVLYPTVEFTAETPPVLGGSTKGKLTAICADRNSMSAFKFYGSTVYVAILNDADNADLASSSTSSLGTVSPVSSIVFWQGYYFAFNTTTTIYRFTGSLTKVNVTGASETISHAVNFNEILYGTDGYKLYRYSGTITTSAWEEVSKLPYPQSVGGGTLEMFIYNNRIMITTDEGLYAYDGIQLVTIEEKRGEVTTFNYRHPAVMRGYLYYFMTDGLYRFNGSLIEKMYDSTEIGNPTDMRYYRGRLFILIKNSAAEGSSRYDKTMGYNYDGTDTLGGSVMTFDGVSMSTYGRLPTVDNSAYTNDYTGQNEVDKLYPYGENNRVAVFKADSQDFKFNIMAYANTNEQTDIVSSIYDGDFPQITKELEKVELVFDGEVTSDTFTVEYRIAGFDGSTAFTTIGTFDSTSPEKLIIDDIPAGITFREIQIRVRGVIGADYGVAKVLIRYTLQPDYKTQWTSTFLCYGDGDLTPLQLQDTTNDIQDVALLRGNIYKSRESDLPVIYTDIDYLILNGAINNSVTTVTVDNTNILKSEKGYIQVGTEIMKYTATTSTTLTVVRGVLGSSAVSHSDDDVAQLTYRVIVRQIQNERIELTDEESISTERTKDSEVTLVLQEV